ncbi:MAG: phasin family protein [Trichloromonadaceae bacterium]
MIELLEKTILTAMGAVSLSQKKAEELLQELKQRFNVTEEEGKALISKLQETAKENQKKLEELALQEVKNAAERYGLVSKEEFEKLAKTVHALEKKLQEAGE